MLQRDSIEQRGSTVETAQPNSPSMQAVPCTSTLDTHLVSMHDAAFEIQSRHQNNNSLGGMTMTLSPRTQANNLLAVEEALSGKGDYSNVDDFRQSNDAKYKRQPCFNATQPVHHDQMARQELSQRMTYRPQAAQISNSSGLYQPQILSSQGRLIPQTMATDSSCLMSERTSIRGMSHGATGAQEPPRSQQPTRLIQVYRPAKSSNITTEQTITRNNSASEPHLRQEIHHPNETQNSKFIFNNRLPPTIVEKANEAIMSGSQTAPHASAPLRNAAPVQQPDGQSNEAAVSRQFRDLTAFDSDTSLLKTSQRQMPQNSPFSSNGPGIADYGKAVVLSSQNSVLPLPGEVSSREPALPELKMVDVYTERDQNAFQQRLIQMQDDIKKTSRILEKHKQRQIECARRWQPPTTPQSAAGSLERIPNRSVFEARETTTSAERMRGCTSGQLLRSGFGVKSVNEWGSAKRSHQVMSQPAQPVQAQARTGLREQPSSSLFHEQTRLKSLDAVRSGAQIQQLALSQNGSQLPSRIMRTSTEISPASVSRRQQVPPKLDFERLMDSGYVGMAQTSSHGLSGDNFLRKNGLLTQEERPPQSVKAATTPPKDYFERDHRPSTKRDQKITYSKTSLDEIQFMEHFKNIQESEQVATPPAMPLSLTLHSRSQNSHLLKQSSMSQGSGLKTNAKDQMTTVHKNGGSRRHGDDTNRYSRGLSDEGRHQQTVAGLGSNPSTQILSQTTFFPPRAATANPVEPRSNMTTKLLNLHSGTSHEHTESLRTRLSQLNDLLVSSKNTPTNYMVSHEKEGFFKTQGSVSSAEKAASYLETVRKRQTQESRISPPPQTEQMRIIDNHRPSDLHIVQQQPDVETQQNYQAQTSLGDINRFVQVQNNSHMYHETELDGQETDAYGTQAFGQETYGSQEYGPDLYVQESYEPGEATETLNEGPMELDPQLAEILAKIGISEAHIWRFQEQEIGLYDFFLLTMEDLKELQLPIAARNRIVAFQRHYANEGHLSSENGVPDLTSLDMDEIIKQVARSESATANTTPTMNTQIFRNTLNGTQLTQQSRHANGYSRMIESQEVQIIDQNETAEGAEIQPKQKRPRTALDGKPYRVPRDYKKSDLESKLVSDYDDFLSRGPSQNRQQPYSKKPPTPTAPQNHFQSAMTQMANTAAERLGINLNVTQTPVPEESSHGSDGVTETPNNQPYVVTSPTPTVDEFSQISYKQQVNNMGQAQRLQQRSNSVNARVVDPVGSPTADYASHLKYYLKCGGGARSGRQGYFENAGDKAHDSSTFNTLSTSQVAQSRTNSVMGQSKQEHEDEKQARRGKANRLYKELKTLIRQGVLDPHSERSSCLDGNSSTQSVLIDKIYRKIHSRGSQKEYTQSGFEKMLKREIRKAVKRYLKDDMTASQVSIKTRKRAKSHARQAHGRQRRHSSSIEASEYEIGTSGHTREPSNSTLLSKAVEQWQLEQELRAVGVPSLALKSIRPEGVAHRQIYNQGYNAQGQQSTLSVQQEQFQSTHDFAKDTFEQRLNNEPLLETVVKNEVSQMATHEAQVAQKQSFEAAESEQISTDSDECLLQSQQVKQQATEVCRKKTRGPQKVYSFGNMALSGQKHLVSSTEEIAAGSGASKRRTPVQAETTQDCLGKLKQLQRSGKKGMSKLNLHKIETHLQKAIASPSNDETRCHNKSYVAPESLSSDEADSLQEEQQVPPNQQFRDPAGLHHLQEKEKMSTQNSVTTLANLNHYTFAKGSQSNIPTAQPMATQPKFHPGLATLHGSYIAKGASAKTAKTSQNGKSISSSSMRLTTPSQNFKHGWMGKGEYEEGEPRDSSQQETERVFNYDDKEASVRNKRLLEQAKKDIASMNEKAQHVKQLFKNLKLQKS